MEDDGMQSIQPIFNLKEFKPKSLLAESFNN